MSGSANLITQNMGNPELAFLHDSLSLGRMSCLFIERKAVANMAGSYKYVSISLHFITVGPAFYAGFMGAFFKPQTMLIIRVS